MATGWTDALARTVTPVHSAGHGLWHDIAQLWHQRIVLTGREPQVLVLGAFLVTIAFARLAAHAVHRGWRVARDVHVRGVHVHHFVPGILLVLVTGYLAIAINVQAGRRLFDIGFGVGAGLTIDEFALWLHLDDVYWTDNGRKSVMAIVVVAAAAGLVLVGVDFWVDLVHRLFNLR
ncbi:MAG: hypothetical protein QOD91_2329 [Frankiales bacterium]|nr:hypothetical protein [Frankiales bacterium]